MKVLVAEDDPIIGLVLCERVRECGHDPIGPAVDGMHALELARESDADVYLFDVEMPSVDGLAAAEQLAAEGRGRPVVIITGVEDVALVDRAVANGVAAYLTKPIDTRELRAALELAVSHDAELDAARRALEDRKLVERAKGLLMSALSLSEPAAFKRLQRTARERNLRLVDVARLVIEQESLLRNP